MEHPIPVGTKVLAIYHGCATCAPNHIEKNVCYIRSSREEKGTYFYTLNDGREVNETDILEVR